MIVALLLRALTAVLVAILVLELNSLDQFAQSIRDQFTEDHRLRICGQFAAFEANARTGLHFLLKQVEARGGEDAVANWIDEWSPDLACAPDEATVYKQENKDLPNNYPNWWFR